MPLHKLQILAAHASPKYAITGVKDDQGSKQIIVNFVVAGHSF
jgi:hypothetical protein